MVYESERAIKSSERDCEGGGGVVIGLYVIRSSSASDRGKRTRRVVSRPLKSSVGP